MFLKVTTLGGTEVLIAVDKIASVEESRGMGQKVVNVFLVNNEEFRLLMTLEEFMGRIGSERIML